jgi:hypothetical protein
MVDLLINGQAHAPRGRPSPFVDVALQFRDRVVKALRVFGDRRWKYGLTGWGASDPKPFVTMPLTYDRAFGGMDEAGSEPQNRVGTGYATKVTSKFAGTPLPNVEDPKNLIKSPTGRPRPAGLGIISRDWEQRVRFAGTYDQKWLDQRMPLLPDDFDMRFNQSAPEEQQIGKVVGGEKLRVSGMTPEGVLGFQVPRGSVQLAMEYRRRSETVEPQLDCILVDCERRQLELTWRYSIDIHGDPFQLETFTVSTDSPELTPSPLQ